MSLPVSNAGSLGNIKKYKFLPKLIQIMKINLGSYSHGSIFKPDIDLSHTSVLEWLTDSSINIIPMTNLCI